MKLSNPFRKLTNGRAQVLKVVAGFALAGAALAATTPAADAQVAFGVTLGGPRVYAPAPRPVYVAPAPVVGYGYGYAAPYVAPRPYVDWRAREWHDRWNYDHRFDHGYAYGYGARGWR